MMTGFNKLMFACFFALALGVFGCGAADEEPIVLDMGADVGADLLESDAGDTGQQDAESDVVPTTLSERPCPEDSDLTYENFGEAMMLTWCTACHASALAEGDRAGAPVGIDLETQADVQLHAGRVWARTGDQNTTMPPVGVPDEDERKALGEWLACGAP